MQRHQRDAAPCHSILRSSIEDKVNIVRFIIDYFRRMSGRKGHSVIAAISMPSDYLKDAEAYKLFIECGKAFDKNISGWACKCYNATIVNPATHQQKGSQ